jgi:thiol-disulfide isomerase/thioredoxin
MKLKLGLLFVVFSVIAVLCVFYAKDYISYDVLRPQTPEQDVKTIEVFSNGEIAFVDYSDTPIAKNGKFEQMPKVYANGDLIIVHFWASWCVPCVNEVPEIISYMKSQHKISSKIYFIAVNLDSELEDIQKFLKSFPQLDEEPFVRVWDKQNEISKYFDIDKLPATVFLQNSKPYRKINGVVDWAKIQFN